MKPEQSIPPSPGSAEPYLYSRLRFVRSRATPRSLRTGSGFASKPSISSGTTVATFCFGLGDGEGVGDSSGVGVGVSVGVGEGLGDGVGDAFFFLDLGVSSSSGVGLGDDFLRFGFGVSSSSGAGVGEALCLRLGVELGDGVGLLFLLVCLCRRCDGVGVGVEKICLIFSPNERSSACNSRRGAGRKENRAPPRRRGVALGKTFVSSCAGIIVSSSGDFKLDMRKHVPPEGRASARQLYA